MALFSKKNPARSPKIESSRRPAVTSYYRSDDSPAKPSPFTKKTRRRNTRRILLRFLDIVLVVILLLGFGYSLMVRPDPKIITSSLAYHPLADYQQAAIDQLRSLKNRDKITLDESSIAGSLQKKFPEITSAQVELPFFAEQPTIRLVIAKPSLLLRSHTKNYVIGSSGVAVGTANQIPNSIGLTVIEDQSGFKVVAGSQVLSSGSINFINALIAQCKLAKVPIKGLTLPPLAQELDLKTTDQPYFVKFYLGGDVLTETGQFLAARKHFSDTHQNPGQYLDVRVEGKIFYK